jgi:uncharacterized BrkB/YihY/UPF0761 family membrane protein
MDPKSTHDNEKQHKPIKPMKFPWFFSLLLVILLTAITLIGLRLLESSDDNLTSQLKGLAVLLVIITFILLLIGSLCLYASVRHIQLVWRWIVSRFRWP